MRRLRELRAEMQSVNEELRNAALSMSEWRWKMSAAGFFHVDRSIMGGVSFKGKTCYGFC